MARDVFHGEERPRLPGSRLVAQLQGYAVERIVFPKQQLAHAAAPTRLLSSIARHWPHTAHAVEALEIDLRPPD